MLTELLNSLLIEKLNLIPFTAVCPNGGINIDQWSYCSDGSCSGDCVGGCDGTPAGGFSRD